MLYSLLVVAIFLSLFCSLSLSISVVSAYYYFSNFLGGHAMEMLFLSFIYHAHIFIIGIIIILCMLFFTLVSVEKIPTEWLMNSILIWHVSFCYDIYHRSLHGMRDRRNMFLLHFSRLLLLLLSRTWLLCCVVLGVGGIFSSSMLDVMRAGLHAKLPPFTHWYSIIVSLWNAFKC